MKAAVIFATTLALLFACSTDTRATEFKRTLVCSTPGAVTMVYNFQTGDVTLNAGEGIQLTTWELKSAGNLLIPENAAEGASVGLFDVVSNSRIFKLDRQGFSKLEYGPILPKGLSFEAIREDSTIGMSLVGGGHPDSLLLFVSPSRPADDDGTWVGNEFAKRREAVRQQEEQRDANLAKIEQLIADLAHEYEQSAATLAAEEELSTSAREAMETRQTTIRLYLAEIRRLGTMFYLQQQQWIHRMVRELKNFRKVYLRPVEEGNVPPDVKQLVQPLEELVDRMEQGLRGEPPFGINKSQILDLIGRDLGHSDLDEVAAEDDRFVDLRPDLANGEIQSLRSPLQLLLRLAWDGQRLTIDKNHWRILFGDKSRQELVADVKALMVSREITLPKLEGSHRPSGSHDDFSPTVAGLFNDLRAKAGSRSGNRRSGTEEYRADLRTQEINCLIQLNRDSFYFRAVETTVSARTLCVRENESGVLRVVLAGDVVLRLKQDADGSVTVVEISPDEVLRLHAADFASLYRENPEYVERKLFPLLDHMSLVPPTSRVDKHVVSRIAQRIQLDQTTEQIHLDGIDAFIDAMRLFRSRSYLTEIVPMLDAQEQKSVREYVRWLSDG